MKSLPYWILVLLRGASDGDRGSNSLVHVDKVVC